jgi:hypothetical protein
MELFSMLASYLPFSQLKYLVYNIDNLLFLSTAISVGGYTFSRAILN